MSWNKLNKEVINQRISERGIEMIGNYFGTKVKTDFICEHQHIWNTAPENVLGGSGCWICNGKIPLTINIINGKLISRQIKCLGDYINNKTKIEFECNKGHKWLATPHSILDGGRGCPICNKQLYSLEKVNNILSNKGIKIFDEYINTNTKTLFQCKCGNVWETTARSLFQNIGCPSCAKYGFDTNKPAILYYVNIKGTKIYKIGVTNRVIEDRFGYDFNKLNIIAKWEYKKGNDALFLEQTILKVFKEFQYKGVNLLDTGNSELFIKDVMELDK